MKKLMTMAGRFRDDDNGAAMVEYSILIGLIAAAAITAVLGIGVFVTGQFANLCATLSAHAPAGYTVTC